MKKVLTLLLLMVMLISPFQTASAQTTDLTKDPNYKTIYNAMVNLKPKVNVKYNSKVFDVFNKVIENHPEIFYIDYEDTRLWTNGVLEIGYKGSTKTIKAQISSLNKKIATIENGAKTKKKTMDKIKYFHDYIVNHSKYDYVNYVKGNIPFNSYNAYGILVKGVGVCEGYAEAMKILLNRAKIPNYLVVGDAGSSNSWAGHAWNLIKVGDKYYHLDATWDDPITSTGKQIKRYDYFMISDQEIKRDHRWDTTKYPKAK